MQRCIVVVGMHRSGTSAFMGVFHILGVNLGENLYEAGEDNPKGFFENAKILQVNEKILKSLNSSYDNLFPLPENWWNEDRLLTYKEEIIEIIEKELRNTEIFGIKDPRLCKLLPFWNNIFQEINIEPHYVIPLRNPLEVADSLEKRNRFSREKSIVLWMTHMLDAEFHTRYFPRVFYLFDELLRNPKKTIDNISGILDIDLPKSYEDVQSAIENFLEPSLKHHNIETHGVREVLLKPVFEFYSLLIDLANKEKISEDQLVVIENIREDFFRAYDYFYNEDVRKQRDALILILETAVRERDTYIGNLVARIGSLEEKLSQSNATIREQVQQIQAKGLDFDKLSELSLIKGSKVWRAAEFFRRLFYIKLLGKFPPLQKGALIITREGFRTFWFRLKAKLRDSFQGKGSTGQKEHLSILDNKIVDSYEAYIENNRIKSHIRKLLVDTSTGFRYRPLISIIMPVYNVEPRWLKAAVDSVMQQIYTNWELCIADDASTHNETLELLRSYENHERIKVLLRANNGNICAASNSALDQAKGEFIAFMDHDDLLERNALFEVVRILQDHPDTDLIHSDEDKIDENDRRYDPQFKPDWSPELFLSYNYVNHFTTIRRKLVKSLGRFRIGYEGAQDYDLILRVIERTHKIRHIPKILYHWRAIKGSTALKARSKPGMHRSALTGLKDHLKRNGIPATVYQPEFAKSMGLPISQLDWPDEGPSVTIIIPTYNQYKLLKKCIESIIKLTTYRDYEILVVDNESDQKDAVDYLDELDDRSIRVERIGNDGRPFSFSRINNLAVKRVKTEYILFLNNDIEVLEPKWLSRLAGYLSIPGVGVTGAKLFYPNKTIQHAGVVMGMHDGIIPDHAFLNHRESAISYYFMAEVARNCSAVTGACLMTRRSDFVKSGGFNQRDFKVSLQDVDYCLRLAKQGLRTVYVAGAEMIHHQSMSRQLEDDPRELADLRRRYNTNTDPYYNPNLSKINSFAPDTQCGLVDYSEFLKTPLRVVIFSHNLELAGAPKAMYDLSVGLKTQSEGKIVVKVVSPVQGPFQSLYDHQGINCQVIDQNTSNIAAGWRGRVNYDTAIEKVREFLLAENPDVVISNTVYGFYVVHAAQQQGFPVIWIISESFDQFALKRSINDFVLQDCMHSFGQAYSVVFGSAGTRNCYEAYNSQHNFKVIHNSVDRRAIDQFIKDVSKQEARQRLRIPSNMKVLLMVGTICERKDQETIAKAAAILHRKRNDFCCYLVGANENIAGAYLESIHKIVVENDMSDVVKIVPETEELYWYYRASDIFLFSSHMECYPLATLEAMAFGLPIITTPCCGVTEQVRSVNALFFNASDYSILADQISCLLDDGDRVKYLGGNSRAIFEYQQTYKEMIEKYERLVFGAWVRGKKNNAEFEEKIS
jgi:glycosyltransferase involved in cell wall biosynthesis